MWNPRRKLAWLVLVPLAVIAAGLFSLPLLLNTADYRALLVEQAELQLGRKVSVKGVSVEVFPYVRIALDDVVIKEPDGTTQFLFADHFFIDLRFFPLLQRKVQAKRILLDKPKLVIRRGASGLLNISDLFSQTAQPSDFATPMLGDEIAIADGEFVFEDSFGAEAARTVTLRHVTTTLKRAGVQLDFKFYAALPYEQAESTFSVTGKVSREALLGARPGGKAVGRLEAKGANLSQLAAFLNDNPVLRRIAVPVDLAGAFEYRWAKNHQGTERVGRRSDDHGERRPQQAVYPVAGNCIVADHHAVSPGIARERSPRGDGPILCAGLPEAGTSERLRPTGVIAGGMGSPAGASVDGQRRGGSLGRFRRSRAGFSSTWTASQSIS